MTEGAAHRLFYALWPPAAPRAELGRAFGAALAAAGGRKVPAENLHLTLAFLGNVPAAEVGRLTAIGAGLALPPGEVVLDRLDWWPRARVLVAAARDAPAALVELQAELTRQLKDGGFGVDCAVFRPHVTLARKVAAPPPTGGAARVAWPLAALALIASIPAAGGSRYTPLSAWESRDSPAFHDRGRPTRMR